MNSVVWGRTSPEGLDSFDDPLGVSCGEDGLRIGPVPLLRKTALGFVMAMKPSTPRPHYACINGGIGKSKHRLKGLCPDMKIVFVTPSTVRNAASHSSIWTAAEISRERFAT